MDACRQVWHAAMHFVQSGGMAIAPHGDAEYAAPVSLADLSFKSLRATSTRQRADLLERAEYNERDARHVRSLFESHRGHKLMRNWVQQAIAQDAPTALVHFGHVFERAQKKPDFAPHGHQAQTTRRVKAVAALVEPDNLRRIAKHTFLPNIVDDLCQRGLLARRDVPITYIRDTRSLIEALNNGDLTPEQYRQIPCRESLDVRELMRRGVVQLTPTTLACSQPWDWKELVALADRRASRWRSLVAWHAFSDEEIEKAVAQHIFHVGHIGVPGPNVLGLLEALTATDCLDVTTAMQKAASRWDPHRPWPSYATRYVRRFATVAKLIEQMPLPVPRQAADINRRYALRLVAHWFVENRRQSSTSDVFFAVPQSRWQRLYAYLAGDQEDGPLPAVQGPLWSACIVCCEPFDGLLLPAGLAACLHPPSMDAACLHRGVLAHHAQRCPEQGCARPLGPDEVFEFELGVERAGEAAWRVVSEAYAKNPLWHFCTTPHCPNGLDLQISQNKRLFCRCCGKVSVFAKTPWTPESMQKLGLEDRRHLATLIEGTRTTNRGSAPAIRECFHCGSATQLIDGCNSLSCKICRRSWNFKWGNIRSHDFVEGGQMYVPRRSWMTDLGLYYGADCESAQDAYAVICRNIGSADLAALMQP